MLRVSCLRPLSLAARQVRYYSSSNAYESWVAAEGQYSFVRLEREEATRSLRITINRPDVRNAFNQQLISEITAAFQKVAELAKADSRPGALPCSVVLTGEGKAFSAGADLNWMKGMAKYTEEENVADAKALFDMFHSIQSCPVPVIARVNGAALGGGTGIIAAADFAFAVSSAKLGFTEVKLGLVPAVISPFLMRKIGLGNCSRFFATGELFDATKGKEIGLVQEAYGSVEELDAGVTATQLAIANNSPQAVRTCKTLIEQVSKFGSLEDSKDYVARAIAGIRISDEGQQGINAFLTKEPAPWVR